MSHISSGADLEKHHHTHTSHHHTHTSHHHTHTSHHHTQTQGPVYRNKLVRWYLPMFVGIYDIILYVILYHFTLHSLSLSLSFLRSRSLARSLSRSLSLCLSLALSLARALSLSLACKRDELTLRAACDCFGCVAHVVTTEHENWLLNYCPSSLDETDVSTGGAPPEGVRELFLTYVSPIHYNVIALPSDPRKASETGY